MGADGVTVNVYDSDWDWDDLLAQTSLGPDGYYDITFWYDDGEASRHLHRVPRRQHQGRPGPSEHLEHLLPWNTPTKEDYSGTDINFGLRHPASESHYAGLNLLASATRPGAG